ncbi:MAG: fimbrial biogenesis outer membrane usher protein [Deltaproteobacteria bacterium]|nr:fimbrial biogenesis outer membrane usher protein [Deltaproteobacteria bacterium]
MYVGLKIGALARYFYFIFRLLARHQRTVFIFIFFISLPALAISDLPEDPTMLPLPIVVPMSVNSVPKGEVLIYLLNKDIYLRVNDLLAAGIKETKGTYNIFYGEDMVLLKSLAPKITYTFDEQTLSLSLTAAPDFFAPTTISMRSNRPKDIQYPRDNSLLLNYAIDWSNSTDFSGFSELAFNSPWGLLYNSVRRTTLGEFVRGPSYFVYDDTENLTRWTLGDAQASTGLLGSSAQFAGISVARNFALDPYFLRQPGHGISGSVLTPATIEIYRNGIFLRREQLPPGPFNIENIPTPVGRGSVEVIMRDAFGESREIISPYYFAASLLSPDITEFSVNLGVLRENTQKSFDYGKAVVLGYYRTGVNDWLTVGGRTDATPWQTNFGPTISLGLPIGELELAGAMSFSENRTGSAGALIYTNSSRYLSFGGSLQVQNNAYTSLNSSTEIEKLPIDAAAFISLPLPFGVGLSLHYDLGVHQNHTATHQFSVNTNWQLGALSFFLTTDLTIEDNSTTTSAFIGLTYTMPQSTSAAVSHQTGANATTTFQMQKPLPPNEGIGYRSELQTFNAGGGAARALMQYQWDYGRYEASYDGIHNEYGAQNTGSVSATGSLVWLDGSLKASRPISNSFALVRLPKTPDVSVLLDNQIIGQTDASGEFLVPNLLPYYGNRISISDADVPFNYEIEQSEVIVAPPYRGGALVEPKMRKMQAIIGKIILIKDDEILQPNYGDLTIATNNGIMTSPLGANAEFYFENLRSGTYQATIYYSGTNCIFALVVPQKDEQFIDLGVVKCIAISE